MGGRDDCWANLESTAAAAAAASVAALCFKGEWNQPLYKANNPFLSYGTSVDKVADDSRSKTCLKLNGGFVFTRKGSCQHISIPPF